ncbi:MAG: hypothetical protein RL114_145 [Actinomycetota bacterium]|jgi:hypothetical protein
MKTGIATTVSVVGVIAAGVAAFAVNSSVLGASSPANSAIVTTSVAGMTPANATPVNNGQVGATGAQATEVTDTTTTYKVGEAGSVVIDTSTGAIVVTGIAPAAGFTSEPARTEANGIVKVHFVSSTQRIEFIAQMVSGVVKVNVVNEGKPTAGSVPPRPRHDDDDDDDDHEEREEHDDDHHEDEDDD